MWAMDVNQDHRLDIADYVSLIHIIWGTTGELQQKLDRSVQAPAPVLTLVLFGDLNGDGQIDIADAVTLAHYVSGVTRRFSAPLDNADVNRDGRINLADVLALMEFLFGGGR